MAPEAKKSNIHTFNHRRLVREFRTITAMITVYCKSHHHSDKSPCPECDKLLDYAKKRLQRCPFQQHKPTCGNCTVHCYKPTMREKIKIIMQFAGPRMISRHPLMAFRHLIDGRKRTPSPTLSRKP